ncbi:MAG: hypothetical protein KJ645_02915, partial [Planctomycetes bacterium]|nr:hypothetical protein [Planctomycetota bacterium]
MLLFFLSASGLSQESSEPGTSCFARRYLIETELAAEVKVSKIYRLGMGVDVVYLDLGRVFLNRLPKDLAERKRQLLLAYRNEFTPGTSLFLLMKRYGAGDRLTCLHR